MFLLNLPNDHIMTFSNKTPGGTPNYVETEFLYAYSANDLRIDNDTKHFQYMELKVSGATLKANTGKIFIYGKPQRIEKKIY